VNHENPAAPATAGSIGNPVPLVLLPDDELHTSPNESMIGMLEVLVKLLSVHPLTLAETVPEEPEHILVDLLYH